MRKEVFLGVLVCLIVAPALSAQAQNKCCLYSVASENKAICTIDNECPVITGWTKLGEWGVSDCDDCFKVAAPPPEEEEAETTTRVEVTPGVTRHSILEFIELLEMAPLIVEELKKWGYDPTKPPRLRDDK